MLRSCEPMRVRENGHTAGAVPADGQPRSAAPPSGHRPWRLEVGDGPERPAERARRTVHPVRCLQGRGRCTAGPRRAAPCRCPPSASLADRDRGVVQGGVGLPQQRDQAARVLHEFVEVLCGRGSSQTALSCVVGQHSLAHAASGLAAPPRASARRHLRKPAQPDRRPVRHCRPPASPRTWYPSSAPRSSWDRAPCGGRADPLCRPFDRGPPHRIRLPLGLDSTTLVPASS